MTQNEMILDHLKQKKTLTARQADRLFGCMRLPARIDELRKDGNNIVTEMVKGKNRFGKTTYHARYRLAEEE